MCSGYLLSHCTRGHRTHAQPQPPKKDIFFWRGILLVKMAETSKVFFFGGDFLRELEKEATVAGGNPAPVDK